jgi:hypothetical protein
MNQRNHVVLMGVFPPLSLRGVKSRVPRESNPFFGGTGILPVISGLAKPQSHELLDTYSNGIVGDNICLQD